MKNHAPENFIKDKETGWYYQKTQQSDAQGNPVNQYLWFDPKSDQYYQNSFPANATKPKKRKGLSILLCLIAVMTIVVCLMHMIAESRYEVLEDKDLQDEVEMEIADPENLPTLQHYQGNLTVNTTYQDN